MGAIHNIIQRHYQDYDYDTSISDGDEENESPYDSRHS